MTEGLGVWGLGFRDWGLGCGFRGWGWGFSLGFGVQGLGVGVVGLGFRVLGLKVRSREAAVACGLYQGPIFHESSCFLLGGGGGVERLSHILGPKPCFEALTPTCLGPTPGSPNPLSWIGL